MFNKCKHVIHLSHLSLNVQRYGRDHSVTKTKTYNRTKLFEFSDHMLLNWWKIETNERLYELNLDV